MINIKNFDYNINWAGDFSYNRRRLKKTLKYMVVRYFNIF